LKDVAFSTNGHLTALNAGELTVISIDRIKNTIEARYLDVQLNKKNA